MVPHMRQAVASGRLVQSRLIFQLWALGLSFFRTKLSDSLKQKAEKIKIQYFLHWLQT